MLTRAVAFLIVTTIGLTAQDVLRGTYEARLSRDAFLNVTLRSSNGFSNWGRSLERSQMQNVRISDNRVSFAMTRAAGVMRFEGTGTENRSRGDFEFTPNANYRRQLSAMNLGEATLKDLFVFAMSDLSIADVKYLEQTTSDNLTIARLVKMMNHGANVEFVRGLEAAGFKNYNSDELIRTRDHGVDPHYIAELRKHGHRLALEEYIRARDHGVTPDYVEDLAEVGYKNLTINDYIRLRDHGVAATFARRMNREHGGTLEVGDLIRLRNRGER